MEVRKAKGNRDGLLFNGNGVFLVLLIISVFVLSIVAYQRFNNRIKNGREVAATTTDFKDDLLQIKRKKLQCERQI